jgi:hypothetical protein
MGFVNRLFSSGICLTAVLPAAAAGSSSSPSAFAAPFQTETPFDSNPGQGAERFTTQYETRQGKTTVYLPEIETSYRFTDDFSLAVEFPFERVTEGGAPYYGYGSTAVTMAYRFYKEQAGSWVPSIAIAPELDLPAPASQQGLGTGYLHAYIPLSFETNFGSWAALWNLAAGINPGPQNRNYAFAGFELARPVTNNILVGGELFYRSPKSTGLKNLLGFSVGVKYSVAKGQDLYASIGRGLINARSTDQ